MKFLSIYYEPNFSDKYFTEGIREFGKIFNVKKIKLNSIDDATNLNLNRCSTWPRILLVHRKINPSKYSCLCLDGISMSKNNLAIVKYQNSMHETLYVLAHEFAHLSKLQHCNSRKCIMGTYIDAGKLRYSWWKIAHKRRLSKDLFCRLCKVSLSG